MSRLNGSQALQKMASVSVTSPAAITAVNHTLPSIARHRPAKRVAGLKTLAQGIAKRMRTVFVTCWVIIVFGIVFYGFIGAIHH